MRRIDQPSIDTDSSYVFYNSPAIAIPADGRVYHSEIGYGYSAGDPLTVEMAIAINNSSVSVNSDEFPHGLTCMQCARSIENGTVAISIQVNPLDSEIWCIACGRDQGDALFEEVTWHVSLQAVRDAIADAADYAPGNGDVRISRTTAETLMFRLGRFPQEHLYLNVPVARLVQFIEEIDRYLCDADMRAVESAYFDQSLDALEALANGE